MKYPLTEIFYSIQGEGHRAGRPTVFIRMAGCNYACSWCDTEFPVNMKMTEEEIRDEILRLVPEDRTDTWVCITGGEPMMHDLLPLLTALDSLQHPHVEIETNGSFPDKMEEYRNWAWITCSPKKKDGQPSDGWTGFADAVKVVYEGQDLSSFICKGGYYYLQPLFVDGDPEATRANFNATIEKVKECPEWRLSLQTQKWMEIR